jgi:hypothetical protein
MQPITTRVPRVLQVAALGALFLAGCSDPPLDPKEYGQVTKGLPDIEGANEPYPLPGLEDPESLKRPKKSISQ